MQALQCFFYALLPVPGVIGLDLRLQLVQILALAAGELPEDAFAAWLRQHIRARAT